MDRMPRPIVVGVNASPASQLALRWAADEALRRDAPVRVVTAYERSHASLAAAVVQPVVSAGVLDTPDPLGGGHAAQSEEAAESIESIRSVREAFDDAVGYARGRVGSGRVTGSFVSTRPAAALVEESARAELVVIGSRSRSSPASVLLGPVSSAVAAHAAGPVVVVRNERAAGSVLVPVPAPVADRIVVGVDGSPESEAALTFAFEAAALRGAHLDVVYAWHPVTVIGSRTWTMDRAETEREARRRELRQRVEPFHRLHPDVSAAEYVLEGRPATLLAKQSETARLMVVGSRGQGGINGLLLGSVSQALLHYAQSTVAVIRGRLDVVPTLRR